MGLPLPPPPPSEGNRPAPKAPRKKTACNAPRKKTAPRILTSQELKKMTWKQVMEVKRQNWAALSPGQKRLTRFFQVLTFVILGSGTSYFISELDFSGGSSYSAEVCANARDRLQQTMLRRSFGNASRGQLQWDVQRSIAACN